MERPRAWMGGFLASVAIVISCPAGAAADTAPTLIGPFILGAPRVGNTLTAGATVAGYPAPTATWSWLRCGSEDAGTCGDVPVGTGETYVVQPLDVGRFLRVRVTATNGVPPDASDVSPPVSVPGTPTPTLVPGSGVPGTTTPAAEAVPLRFINPFPIVRVKGSLTATGARITLFTVRAPRGVRIVVRCEGTSCSRRRWAARTAARLTHLRPYERALVAGTRITVRVTAPLRIGKHTLLVIRRGRPPWRRDRCVMPGSSRPIRCPEPVL